MSIGEEIARGVAALLVALAAGGTAVWATVRYVVRLERTSVTDLRADREHDRALIEALRNEVAQAQAAADRAEAEADECQRARREDAAKIARLEQEVATLKVNLREMGGAA